MLLYNNIHLFYTCNDVGHFASMSRLLHHTRNTFQDTMLPALFIHGRAHHRNAVCVESSKSVLACRWFGANYRQPDKSYCSPLRFLKTTNHSRATKKKKTFSHPSCAPQATAQPELSAVHRISSKAR